MGTVSLRLLGKQENRLRGEEKDIQDLRGKLFEMTPLSHRIRGQWNFNPSVRIATLRRTQGFLVLGSLYTWNMTVYTSR